MSGLGGCWDAAVQTLLQAPSAPLEQLPQVSVTVWREVEKSAGKAVSEGRGRSLLRTFPPLQSFSVL